MGGYGGSLQWFIIFAYFYHVKSFQMTGLDLEKDKIMEVACLVTDSELNILAEGPDIIIHQPEDLLNNMHEWCISQHGKV